MTFIVRLLDSSGALLSWARVPTRVQRREASADLVATAPTRFVIERHGTTAQLSIEWPDLGGIARLEPVSVTPVKAGQAFDFLWFAPLWRIEGHADVPKPAVTESSGVVLTPPPAVLGVRT